MTDNDRWPTCLHEASHAVMALAVGWPAPAITVRPGSHSYGCALFPASHQAIPDGEWALHDLTQPFALWPPELRTHVERAALVYVAGPTAEEMFCWLRPAPGRAVRTREPVRVRAAATAASLPPVTADEAAGLAAVTGDPSTLSDEEHLARFARAAHGDDFRAVSTWLGFIGAQAEAILRRHEARVRRLADALTAQDVLGAAAVAAVAR